MDFFRIAEDKIKEAIKKKDLDNLPGMGQPLELKDDFPGMSEEWKMAYRVLKNAGYSPEDVKNEIFKIEELLQDVTDEEAKKPLQAKLKKKRMELERMLEKRGTLTNSRFGSYSDEIFNKFN
ncbi:DnaJ family domain-containing protein [Neobacillus niacini]|uniref:DnaJ family domain-containing protein n=1 Tax=Neobacillus niacini TaxID=86668 RepID=UPI002FFF4DD1